MSILDQIKNTFFLRSWSFFNVPMIYNLKPSVLELNEERVKIRIPLRRYSKNHLNSLYFGALCAGADIAGGLFAMHWIKKNKLPVNLVFSALDAKFLKRATGLTVFTCLDGASIKTLIEEALTSGNRVFGEVHIIATCPEIDPEETIATFRLAISFKKQSS